MADIGQKATLQKKGKMTKNRNFNLIRKTMVFNFLTKIVHHFLNYIL